MAGARTASRPGRLGGGAQEQQRVVLGLGPRVRTTSPRRAPPVAMARGRGCGARRLPARPGHQRVDPPPGQARHMGDPAAEQRTWTWADSPSASPSGSASAPTLRRDPVGGSAGDVVEHVADVEQRQPRASRPAWGVDQPRGHHALSTAASRRPPSASLTSGTEGGPAPRSPRGAWDQPFAAPAAGARPRRQSASISPRSRRLRPGRRPGAGRRAGRARPGGRRRRRHLAHRPDRVVEAPCRSPRGGTRACCRLAQVGAVLVDEHHVEVRVGRELAAPVARRPRPAPPRWRARRRRVRLAQSSSAEVALVALCCSHRGSVPSRPAALRARTRPARRCGPGRRTRPG